MTTYIAKHILVVGNKVLEFYFNAANKYENFLTFNQDNATVSSIAQLDELISAAFGNDAGWEYIRVIQYNSGVLGSDE